MILVDTCLWIEWLTAGSLSASIKSYFDAPEKLIIPTIVQFELYKWICREKDETTAMEILGITEQGRVVPLDTPLALYAADLSKQHNLAAADAIVYATSQLHRVELITCDKRFKNLQGVKYIIKGLK